MFLKQDDICSPLYVLEVVSKSVYFPRIIKASDIKDNNFDDHVVWKGPAPGGLSLRNLELFFSEEFLQGEAGLALPLVGLRLRLRLLQLLDVLVEGGEALAFLVVGLEVSSQSTAVLRSRSKMR